MLLEGLRIYIFVSDFPSTGLMTPPNHGWVLVNALLLSLDFIGFKLITASCISYKPLRTIETVGIGDY